MQDRRRYRVIIILVILAMAVVLWAEFMPENLAIYILAIALLFAVCMIAINGYFERQEGMVPQSLQAQNTRIEFLEGLSKSVSLPFMILSASGRVVFMSEALQKSFPNLKPLAHYSNLTRSSSFVDGVRAALDGQKVEPFVFETHRAANRIFEVQISPIHLGDFGGVRGELLVQILDRTEERRGDMMRRDFIANASHELRTPLASIVGGLETIRSNEDMETVEHFLPIMTKEAERMQRLLTDLMSLSRIEMNEHYAPEGEVNLRAVIEDSVQAVSSYAKSEKVKIVNNFNKDAWVKGDADQLQQIVTNILDNAIKYSGDHPVVTFDTREHNPRFPKKIGVSISDNGPGIEAANIPRLTERFYRVSKTESRNKGGTGLGLAIVKHMILRHQGELQIESKLGEGSVFTIWLPVLENINNNK